LGVISGVIVLAKAVKQRQNTKAVAKPPERLSGANAGIWPDLLAFFRGLKSRASESLPPSHYILCVESDAALLSDGRLGLRLYRAPSINHALAFATWTSPGSDACLLETAHVRRIP
jgi:hypothetical protein